MSYGILAWGCASKTRLDCLRIKHNKCLRTIFFVHPRESAAPCFKLLTILKLDNIYKWKICCFIHRMRNETDSIPDIFLDVLTPASRIHTHNTRFVSKLNYFRPRVSTNLGKKSFKFSAPKIWETVPPGLKCLPYQKFKKEWKSYLLTNQILPCLYVLSLILSKILFLSLLLPIIWTWRCPTRKLLLLWTLYTNELNVF